MNQDFEDEATDPNKTKSLSQRLDQETETVAKNTTQSGHTNLNTSLLRKRNRFNSFENIVSYFPLCEKDNTNGRLKKTNEENDNTANYDFLFSNKKNGLEPEDDNFSGTEDVLINEYLITYSDKSDVSPQLIEVCQ